MGESAGTENPDELNSSPGLLGESAAREDQGELNSSLLGETGTTEDHDENSSPSWENQRGKRTRLAQF